MQSLHRNPTPWTWTVIRLAFVTLWTLTILTFKEELRAGALFARLGADPKDLSGRWFLLALVLVCLVLVAFLFRGRRVQPAG